ncbi:SCP-like protein [Oesophagostomum dentatum]|uniref:SCP-like protein n=1 Tax=Oesophagostomum dentatum TaxID=61180 RepID=A0A0B1S0Z7_OESDE|nr:SCP-like protein [Oesophagostomum dentatum]
MTDDLRIQFLDMHNFRRSELAKGNVARKNGNRYPIAANMARMSYDCSLETEALSYTRQCPYAKSGSTNVGENFFRVSGLNTWADGVNQAVTSWWKVVRAGSSGVGVNAVTFRQVHVGTDIESWSQMAWATTNKVGCSIVKCLNEYVVDCRYLEK